MNSKKGFSLIEMVVVMAIIGILSSIALMSWNRYVSNANLRAAVREIETDIKFMKESAVARQGVHTIAFFQGTSSYTRTVGGAAEAAKMLSSFSPEVIMTDVNLAGGGTVITFLARGLLNPPSGSVQISNGRGSTGTITFNQAGRTYVTFAMQ